MEGTSNTEKEKSFEKIREERQREVDRLSLELLSNKKHYKKLIAKECPEEQLKLVDESRKFSKYKSRIAALFIELLDEYENDREEESSHNISHELRSLFKETIQKTVQHLEWAEYNRFDKLCDFEDEDVMFASTAFSHSKFNIRKKRHPSEDVSYFSDYWQTDKKSSRISQRDSSEFLSEENNRHEVPRDDLISSRRENAMHEDHSYWGASIRKSDSLDD